MAYRDHFGRFGSFYAALFSFVVCFFGARLRLHVGDRLIDSSPGPYDASAYAGTLAHP